MGLKENHQESFCQDSDLVWVTRQRYFEAHHPTFDEEGSHNLSGLFWEMITPGYHARLTIVIAKPCPP